MKMQVVKSVPAIIPAQPVGEPYNSFALATQSKKRPALALIIPWSIQGICQFHPQRHSPANIEGEQKVKVDFFQFIGKYVIRLIPKDRFQFPRLLVKNGQLCSMAPSGKIEEGDIVKLASHPTKFMTAHSIDGDFVECVWPGLSGETIFRNFKASELTLVSKKGENPPHTRT